MSHSKKKSPVPRHQARLDAVLAAEILRLEKARALLRNVDKEVYDLGMELFTKPEALADWLTAPQRALGEEIPLVVLAEPNGRKKVLNVLGAVIHGVFL
jgi:uncharacterized protein (DUF2384 family)